MYNFCINLYFFYKCIRIHTFIQKVKFFYKCRYLYKKYTCVFAYFYTIFVSLYNFYICIQFWHLRVIAVSLLCPRDILSSQMITAFSLVASCCLSFHSAVITYFSALFRSFSFFFALFRYLFILRINRRQQMSKNSFG